MKEFEIEVELLSHHGIITQGITSPFLSVIFLFIFNVPIDFTNDQNTMRGAIRGNIYTLNIKIRIKYNT